AGRGDHSERFPQRAAFRQLDVHSIYRTGEPRDVARHDAALIDYHREDPAPPHGRHALEVVGRQRLLDELDAVFLQDGEHGQRAIAGPAGVGVHAERLVRGVANRAENRVIAIRAELDLQDRVRGRLAYFLPYLFGRVEADREGEARRARRIEAPQPPHGLLQALADEIV